MILSKNYKDQDQNMLSYKYYLPIPVAERSKVKVCGRSFARIAGSNSAEVMDVCCECCVLSGRGFCDEPISRLKGKKVLM
jgi:hypothetical protein